jgi:hypothetical protein
MSFVPVNLTPYAKDNPSDVRRPLILVTQGEPNQAWEDEFNRTDWTTMPSFGSTPPAMTEDGIAVPNGIGDEAFNAISQAVNRANDFAKASSRPTTAEAYEAWFHRSKPQG